MTNWNMSEQTRNSVTEAIWKFFSAFRSRTDIPNEYPVIGLIAALLYLMKKGYVSIQTNVQKDSTDIISLMDLSYMEITSKLHYGEWKSLGISNKAIVSDYPKDDSLADTISKYLSLLDRMPGEPAYIFEFVETILKYQEGDLYYLQVLDIALSKFSSNHSAGQFTQPVEFAELASALVESKGKDIYNPFSGLMSFATAMKEYASFTGVERDSFIADISIFRTHLAGIQDKASCIPGDVRDWSKISYDIIVSTPPIGVPISVKDENRPIRSEFFCLKNFESLTNDNGVLFTFVVPSVLFDSTRAREIRRELTEKNYLDAVISLPANLMRPYTSISLVAVLLKKGRDKDAPIKMLDASEFNKGDKKKPILDVEVVVNCLNNPKHDNCVFVTQDDIRRGDYIWSVEKYLNPIRESFPEGYEVISLGDVVELIRGERHFEEKSGHLAQIADLAPEGEDCIRTVDFFETSRNLAHATKITEPVILLSSIRLLKPTFCEASPEKPLFLHPNLWACRITQGWVSPTYLCLEISRRFVRAAGNVIPRISRRDLLGMRIAVPSVGLQRSFEEQNNLYKEAANNAKLAKAKELGLQSLIESMKAEYINTVRTRKHDMMPYMRELGSVSRSIRGYIGKYGSPELQSKMANLFSQFDDAFNGLSALVDVFSQENKFGTPEVVNIDAFLRQLARKYDDRSSAFSVQYYCDDNALKAYGLPAHDIKKKNFSMLNGFISFEAEISKSIEPVKLFVEIAPLDLDRVVHNIIDNAVQHGFIDAENIDYCIDITLTVDPERDMFQIDFSNNGIPLPSGMDKKSYGLLGEKAGVTGRTGQGGHIVKSIVEHYKGDYDIFMDGENTVVRILLPISKSNGQNV